MVGSHETVTFLFTDIEGSTQKWDSDPSGMSAALRRHNELLLRAFESHKGRVFKSTGDGYCSRFDSTLDALNAAIEGQLKLNAENWILSGGLRVRMAIHAGLAEPLGDDYIGPTLNRVSRILSAAHGGQILLSTAANALVSDALPDEARIEPLGSIALAGIVRPECVFQVYHPDLPHQFPPLKSSSDEVAVPKHNLPFEERPFIGRREEVAQLLTRIVNGEQRLITISGIGGIGKTRLAVHVGSQALEHFPAGVWLIDCDSLSNKDQIVSATLAAIGAEFDPLNAEKSLLEALSTRKTLLIFDCFEKLVANKKLIDSLLQSAPGVQFLVTSRAVLGSNWEFEFPLGPFSAKRQEVGESDSVALFAEAASHVQGRFSVGKRNRPLVLRIVKELEHVPLAIVLAAGRLRHLSLSELYDQVRSRRLDVLRRAPAGADRHESLISVIEGTFDLLSHQDRTLATKLSVFEGGFTLEDASSVLAGDLDLLENIAKLRDHSLLVSNISAQRMRYRALDTVREYLIRFGQEADLSDVRAHHAAYFSNRAKAIRHLFESGHWQTASSQLWTDAGNFRGAIKYAIGSSNLALVRTFAASLARAYFEAGALADFDALMAAAENAAQSSDDILLQAELHGLRGAFARRGGDDRAATRYWSARKKLFSTIKDADGEADSLLDLADMAFENGDHKTLADLLGDYTRIEKKLKPGPIAASGLLLRARCSLQDGDQKAALIAANDAESLVRGMRANNLVFYVWRGLTEIYRTAGVFQSSEELCLKMLSDALDGNYVHYAEVALLELSRIYADQKRIEEAANALAIALKIPRTSLSGTRTEAKKRKEAFEQEYGAESLENAIVRASRASWAQLAAGLVPAPASV